MDNNQQSDEFKVGVQGTMTENTTTAAQPEVLLVVAWLNALDVSPAVNVRLSKAADELRRLHALPPAPSAQEPEMATPCGACGQDYGVHDGNRCPIGTPSYFRPTITSRPQADQEGSITRPFVPTLVGKTVVIRELGVECCIAEITEEYEDRIRYTVPGVSNQTYTSMKSKLVTIREVTSENLLKKG
jgi:hypothetical protein